MDALEERAAFCRSLVKAAGELAMQGFGRARHLDMKGPQDYLTETDGLCEAFIRDGIARTFPQDGFFGEETGGVSAGNLWVVDPIDGTANFARNIPHFCVALAYVADGRTEIGAIYNPATDELYFARRGHGATLNGKPIQVAATQSASAATVEYGWSPRIAHTAYMQSLDALLLSGFNVRRAGSGALGLAYVADGRVDAYAELHMNSWDCLAGLLLVEEAGGRICPFFDMATVEGGGAVLASTPLIAKTVSAATRIPLQAPLAETVHVRAAV
ncbi:inositol monophosphatase family protein [Rhizobium sp. Root482]|uniref:inositol monophosphatase family protein n=1 Tax=Rhizobium sp. Root482 TaxID=1736543 RepID=UPI0007009F29|nr:inositol monophosphatase [Rhizobium sp. Root482]KQY13717.1 inositol monophosphatase [Rhizobium sp. Root482]